MTGTTKETQSKSTKPMVQQTELKNPTFIFVYYRNEIGDCHLLKFETKADLDSWLKESTGTMTILNIIRGREKKFQARMVFI